MKVKLASGFYFLIGIVHIMAEVAGSISAAEISKVMLMPALIYLVFAEAQGMVTLARLLLAVGLIFSWVGDMLLTQESEMYFLGGL
ncbi:MAG: putative membrane protein YhhN, partial [Marinoscillum sp.]